MAEVENLRLGIVGSGTMGSGIALAALYADLPVVLYDVVDGSLKKAESYIDHHLQHRNLSDRKPKLVLTDDLSVLGDCAVVIEAAPEELELKRQIFTDLESSCSDSAVLVSNTSTLPLAAIASGLKRPERMGGMHFFNPAPVMPLVEIGRTAKTSPETLDLLIDLCALLEKTPVVTRDTPGFIVNRVARPFYGEALRILGEAAASHEQIDLLSRMAGGFRMGPFELMDLIGVDVNFAATKSMYEQTFGEPRYRPHPLQEGMVRDGRLGRKAGIGFYDYGVEEERAAEKAISPGMAAGEGMILLTEGDLGPRLSEWISRGGYSLWETHGGPPVMAVLAASRQEGLESAIRKYDSNLGADIPILCQAVDVTVAEVGTWMKHPQRLVGFDSLFFVNGPAATLVAGAVTTEETRHQVDRFVEGLGRLAVWVEDSPGLVLPRIICGLINESAFALGEGIAGRKDIDLAMKLGANHPHGPLEWARILGSRQVVHVLQHLHREFGEERYRIAPLLRRWARQEDYSQGANSRD